MLRARRDGNEEMRRTEQVKQRKIEEVVIGGRSHALRKVRVELGSGADGYFCPC